ncbi:hypothetical protein PIB30_002413 [Stylosanthes scabra]|uniref:Uncharacterized protein n=1 Tax=Stylosanthes scabra TaxID=79078 RepID=A0ABU6W696_9FABA|nr:hypothetical protein [Stylosanthes scabra]
MTPRGRFRRAARAAPAPEPAEEVGQGAPAGGAPQAVEKRESLIAQALFLPYACSGEADPVHDRGWFRGRHPAAGFRLRRSTPVCICGALEAGDAYVLPPMVKRNTNQGACDVIVAVEPRQTLYSLWGSPADAPWPTSSAGSGAGAARAALLESP